MLRPPTIVCSTNRLFAGSPLGRNCFRKRCRKLGPLLLEDEYALWQAAQSRSNIRRPLDCCALRPNSASDLGAGSPQPVTASNIASPTKICAFRLKSTSYGIPSPSTQTWRVVNREQVLRTSEKRVRLLREVEKRADLTDELRSRLVRFRGGKIGREMNELRVRDILADLLEGVRVVSYSRAANHDTASRPLGEGHGIGQILRRENFVARALEQNSEVRQKIERAIEADDSAARRLKTFAPLFRRRRKCRNSL